MRVSLLHACLRRFVSILFAITILLSSLSSFGSNIFSDFDEIIAEIDTTGLNCDLQTGSIIEFSEDISDKNCVELVANEAIDLTGDFNSVSGNTFDARIGNTVAVTEVYAIPTYGEGVVMLDKDGNVTYTFLNLEYFEDADGNAFIRDLAYSADLNAEPSITNIKRYIIGYSDKYKPNETAFTPEQMRDGINVNAYKGREIMITAYKAHQEDEWLAHNSFQQAIFIPDNKFEPTKKTGNITYYHTPTTRFYKQSLLPYFDEYIPKLDLSDGDIVGVLAKTEKESLNPTWHTKNISNPCSPEYKNSMAFLADDFVNSIPSDFPHPVAYQKNSRGEDDLEAWYRWYDSALKKALNNENLFKARVIYAFRKQYERPYGRDFESIFINNELGAYWTKTGYRGDLFMSWVKEAYAQIVQEKGSNIVPWAVKVYNANTRASDIGNVDREILIPKTYGDLTFDSRKNFDNFSNWGGKYGRFSPPQNVEWGANANDVGGYVTNLYNYELPFQYIYNGMLAQEHNFPKKSYFVFWHDVEPIDGQFGVRGSWFRRNGKAYKSFVKQVVGPEIMYSLGASAAFFSPPGKGGMVIWSDPVFWAENNPKSRIYPLNSRELTSSGEKVIINEQGRVWESSQPITFINQALDGFQLVKQHREILENSDAIIADIKLDGEWFIEEDKSPFAAAVNHRPFVAYRKYNNELLVFAYAWYNHNIINSTFRTEDGEEFDIEIKGCYPTIAKIALDKL